MRQQGHVRKYIRVEGDRGWDGLHVADCTECSSMQVKHQHPPGAGHMRASV
jgi:hypothetical protein